MAHIFVKNSLNNTKTVKLDVNLPKYVVKEHADGDPRWLLEVATTYPSASGTRIRPEFIDTTINDANIDKVIEAAVANIASQIDWEPFVEDKDTPYITTTTPTSVGEVPIHSNVYIDIKDDVPSAGIDLSAVQIIVNNGTQDFDVTVDCEITGDPFSFNIAWKPPMRRYSTYH